MKINKVIALLTVSDIFTWGAYSLFSSLAGLYFAQKFGENTVEIIGIGTGIFFMSRALFQLPIGYFTDKARSDLDEIAVLFFGGFVMGTPFMLYPFISNALVYYGLQFMVGIGMSMNLNSWRKLFATNLGKNRAGKDYGIYETFMSLSSALILILGGIVANLSRHYFDIVIFTVGLCVVLGGIVGALIVNVKQRNHKGS